MPYLNQVTLMGHLGRDAEVKETKTGDSILKFSIAVSERWKDKATSEFKERTDWFNVIAWSRERLAEYLKKGTTAIVIGSLRTDSYTNKDGQKVNTITVVANEIKWFPARDKRESAAPVPF